MPRILLVDDDPDQLEIRKLILEGEGHQVATSSSRLDALSGFLESTPDVVVMDLRLPGAVDGLQLIRELHAANHQVRIVVLSGWPADLTGKPEEALVLQVIQKPVKSHLLLRILGPLGILVLLCFAPALFAGSFTFHVSTASEVTAVVEMSSSGTDWSRKGREGVLADVKLDGGALSQVMVYTPAVQSYAMFLGALTAGEHRLEVERNGRYSAAVTELSVRAARFEEHAASEASYAMVAHAPIVYARPNTVGKFTDIPLLAYCEQMDGYLQYSIIFSNEDGGTSTRALMARWGRTTDIEHVYRVWLDPAGRALRSTIQSKGHADVAFTGVREGNHPLLYVSTVNNMVAGEGASPIRYRLTPHRVDLSNASREAVMDQHSFTYAIAAQELEREAKLRPFATVDGQKISDVRNYLYLEMRIANRDSRIAARVQLAGDPRWRSSHLGRTDYAMERDGWVRTTIELPPGTRASQVVAIGVECLVEPAARDKPAPVAGSCHVERISRAFFLDRQYVPQPALWRTSVSAEGWRIPTGETFTWTLQ
ncbi:MAG: response regulator [Acidobacteriia bacterium]|nr:response regulator [Terriglobia bacterium]